MKTAARLLAALAVLVAPIAFAADAPKRKPVPLPVFFDRMYSVALDYYKERKESQYVSFAKKFSLNPSDPAIQWRRTNRWQRSFAGRGRR